MPIPKFDHFSSYMLDMRRHINLLCRSCYYQLRQLRVVSRSLSPAAASTLVHAFVVSRLKCLDRLLRTAARLVGRIPKFGRVSVYNMRDVLHWLPLPVAHCLPRRCIGSALHGRFGTTLSPGTVLPHCYY